MTRLLFCGRSAVFGLLLLASLPLVARAEVVLLVPGFGETGSWRESGATAVLAASGWADGGELRWTPGGIWGLQTKGWPREFYTVALPDMAPLEVQSRVLGDYVAAVRKAHPDEELWLVGHSAGGVAARMAMVEWPNLGVSGLITIASPHRGTELAGWGALASDSPMAAFAPMFGMSALNRSRGLFHELIPEQPGDLLFWLNRQPHPAARYISVVRSNDAIVPPPSEDLNGVAALRGRAETVVAGRGHHLAANDGALVARLLITAKSP